MPNKKLARRVDPRMIPLRPELPSVPDAFIRAEYEGWPVEVFKRFQLKQYQRTQAERLEVLKQINEIHGQCLALARNEANWRHLEQEDRLRQKRLDVEEMELEQRMEDLVYERERKRQERISPATPATSSKRRDPVEHITAQLEEAIRTEAGIKEAFAHARKKYPHLETWLSEWEAKVSWDLRERKWS